jgi:histidine kinase
MQKSARFWAGVVAINIAASMLANIAFRDSGWQGVRQFLQASALSSLFSLSCSSLCIVGLPHLVPLARRWLPFPLDWAAIVVVLIGFASAGMLIALGTLAAVGYIRSADTFVRWFAGTVKIAIITTILFGVFGTIVESLRSRLDAATLALRTKERDEAEARRAAAEAQLASLESRVHPHFLFNTLNSIAALIHEDPAGAERMTGQLAALLRSSRSSARGSANGCATTCRPMAPLPTRWYRGSRCRRWWRTASSTPCRRAAKAPRSPCARRRTTVAPASRSKTTVRDSTRRRRKRVTASPSCANGSQGHWASGRRWKSTRGRGARA